MNTPTPIVMDIDQHAALPFPRSLPEFQRLYPDDAACAEYFEKARWEDGFVCPHCGAAGEPFRIATRPGVLACRKCRRQTGLTVGAVMERSHTPLSTWFWAAYLVASQTPGMSAVQFQRRLGLSRYETAFQILHKLRAGMVRPDQDRIGGDADEHVEVDETWVGGRTRGEGRGVHHKVLVACAVEARRRKPGTGQDKGLRMGAMRGAFGWQSPLTEAPDRFVGLSMAPSLRER
jgi:Transposase zinc-ribbon domain